MIVQPIDRRSPEVAVVADDLTGAADTGVQFCDALEQMYLCKYSAEQLPVVADRAWGAALYTDSRHLDQGIAVQRIGAAVDILKQLAPRSYYKKIDSCLRGNIGCEIEALLIAASADMSFVAPALPAQGRTTKDDIHMVHGVEVARSEMAGDPLNPVDCSQLSALLRKQCAMTVAHVGLATLEGTFEDLALHVSNLLESGCRHVAFDATEDAHLETIANLARQGLPDRKILLAGSAGLAAALAQSLDLGGRGAAAQSRPFIRRWLFVCGSASEVGRRQLRSLLASTALTPLPLAGDALAGRKSGDFNFYEDGAGGSPAASGWVLFPDLSKMKSSGGVKVEPASVIAALAGTAAALLARQPADGLFLSGGDTAAAVLEVLGARGLRLHEEVFPGLVRGALRGGVYDGMPVVTKAGAFGDDEVLVQLFQLLQ